MEYLALYHTLSCSVCLTLVLCTANTYPPIYIDVVGPYGAISGNVLLPACSRLTMLCNAMPCLWPGRYVKALWNVSNITDLVYDARIDRDTQPV
jgi:hypothetical protein